MVQRGRAPAGGRDLGGGELPGLPLGPILGGWLLGVLFTLPQFFQGILGTDAMGSGLRFLP
jgi:MFS transporter, DHA2 family, multidrug resistance protein